MRRDGLRVERHASMAAIDAVQWDMLTGGHATLSHALLDAFETSGCVSPATGWQPDHLALYDASVWSPPCPAI